MKEEIDENEDFFNNEILTIKKSQTRTSLAERCCTGARNVSFGNSLPKFCLKSSKITDFWEASSPFSNLVRRRSSQHIRIQVNLIEEY
uniref:Uncharacterized protein n=1 Tax=Romanomermis culicivorax TaxID=13658 RepID=A0A915IZ69_ROMCU